MKFLIIFYVYFLIFAVNAEIYRADFALVGKREIKLHIKDCGNPCWLEQVFVKGVKGHKAINTAVMRIDLTPTTGNCNGVTTEIYSAKIPVAKGLHYLTAKACNNAGCSELSDSRIGDYICDGQPLYFYGE